MARSSVKIGIIMLVIWVIPVFGLFLALTGLLLALLDKSKSRPDLVRAGIFLNSLGISLALLNVTVSLYLFLSGMIDPFTILNQFN